MVISAEKAASLLHIFQYSLCRVVLMVPGSECLGRSDPALSVLALSSRFDGRLSWLQILPL